MLGPTERVWDEWGERRHAGVPVNENTALYLEIMWLLTNGDYGIGQWVVLETVVSALAGDRSKVRRQMDNLTTDGRLAHRKDPDGSLWYAVTEWGMVERPRIRCYQYRRDTHDWGVALVGTLGWRS